MNAKKRSLRQKKAAEAEAAKLAAEKAAAEAARLAQLKLERNARFSGPFSIYHEAPSTWVDYPVIQHNEEDLQRKSISAKAAANDWLAERRKARTSAP